VSNLDDIYGPFPGRPDHPDMQVLSETIVALDNLTESDDFDFATHVGQIVDVECLAYLAAQRIMRLGIAPIPLMVGFYCDAFMAGAEFGKRRATEAADAATIAEVFGDEPTD
jgi:hypothetical protein